MDILYRITSMLLRREPTDSLSRIEYKLNGIFLAHSLMSIHKNTTVISECNLLLKYYSEILQSTNECSTLSTLDRALSTVGRIESILGDVYEAIEIKNELLLLVEKYIDLLIWNKNTLLDTLSIRAIREGMKYLPAQRMYGIRLRYLSARKQAIIRESNLPALSLVEEEIARYISLFGALSAPDEKEVPFTHPPIVLSSPNSIQVFDSVDIASRNSASCINLCCTANALETAVYFTHRNSHSESSSEYLQEKEKKLEKKIEDTQENRSILYISSSGMHRVLQKDSILLCQFVSALIKHWFHSRHSSAAHSFYGLVSEEYLQKKSPGAFFLFQALSRYLGITIPN
ncbi:hypothetical protein NEOKW01_1209 [Nematocida sp. AWRm80]|nr:hypothetical protein NEOKW01_1209 [Nematocida sp. AWRm80]